ncbi:odorant receptor 13a-like isoform X4 [Temnothorax curvispinosus]|uniref:Odorant receptor n=1 Tax=Temnothorax curvispinosus TaxID=300111 RepID=A0A6J1Q3M2_9HYME|nr:odorant receptor 13a-like isoform X4 [Temnothorax curvispinosus]
MKIENTVSQAIEISLRIFGIWPNTSCVLLRRLFWTVMLVTEQVFQYRYIVVHFHLIEFIEMMRIIGSTMAYTIFLFKLLIFWYKQRTFNRILTMMANNWEKCSDTKFSMLITRCNAKLSQRFVNMTVILYLTAVIFFSSKILVKHDNGDTASNVSTRLLILDMDLPFDANRRFIYESIIIVQFLHLVLCSEAIGLLNALLINLILHISGQIDILRKSVMDIFPKEGNGRLSRFVVQKIIKKHQEIIIFSEHIEDLYSYIAMVLFVTDTLIICCLGFTIVASKSIGDAAYDSLWYESDSKDSRIILFLIMRSQNQLTITIGKIMNLSLDRFGSIIKASASYISVLFAM